MYKVSSTYGNVWMWKIKIFNDCMNIYISVLVNIPKGVDTAADRSKDFLEVRIHFN